MARAYPQKALLDARKLRDMPSRRAFVAGGVAAGTGAAGLAHLRPGPIETRDPDADTWPLHRYSATNAAASPDAAVPPSPGVAWRVEGPSPSQSSPGYPDQAAGLVVGVDRIYVGGASVAAIDRTDGTVAWTDDGGGQHLALGDDRIYVGATVGTPLRALDATDGTRQWTVPGESTARQVLLADGMLLVGWTHRLSAHALPDGSRLWADSELGNRKDGVLSAVHGGTSYSVDRSGLVGSRSQSLPELALGRAPARRWNSDSPGRFNHPHYPAAADGRVLVGSKPMARSEEVPPLVAYDPASGTVAWRLAFPDDPGDLVGVGTPAVVGDRGVTALEFGDRSPDSRRHAVAGLSLGDGTVEWRRQVTNRVHDVVLGESTALVATAATEADPGAVRALDFADGSERWRLEFEHDVYALALVDGSIFAALGNGAVVATG